MAKKKKLTRGDALNELKTLESKWLKDHRVESLQPIQSKVIAAKVAAMVDFVEQSGMLVDLTNWPLTGAEDLVKIDESNFKRGLADLQKVGVVNSSLKIKKAVGDKRPKAEDIASEDGFVTFRCVKPGGVNLPETDEYVLEDQEVTYSEEAISASQTLQMAIANEWLVRVQTTEPST